jgi:hypothetical protein
MLNAFEGERPQSLVVVKFPGQFELGIFDDDKSHL